MRNLFIVVLLLSVAPGFAQLTEADSLKQLLSSAQSDSVRFTVARQLIVFYKNRNIDSSRIYIALAKDLVQTRDTADYYGIIFYEAEVSFNAGNYDAALASYQQYIDFHQTLGSDRQLAEGYNGLALVHLYIGNNDSTMQYALRCLPIFEAIQDTVGQIQVYYLMGQVKSQIDEYAEGRVYLERGLKLAKAIQHNFYVPAGYNGIATTLLSESESIRDSSESEYFQMQAVAKETYLAALSGFKALGIPQYVGAIHHNIGLIELNLEDWSSAKSSIEKALALSESYASPRQKHAKQSSLAVALYHLGIYDRAEHLLADGLAFYQENNDTEGIQSNLARLKELNTAKQDFKKALVHADELLKAQENIFESSKVRQIEELEVKYETEQKEQQVALLNAQNETALLRIRSSQRLSLGLGLITLLLVGFAILLYRLNQKIKAQKSVIEKSLGEKEILLREIHHRVKNNLQVISSLLNLQSRHVEDGKAQVALREGQNRVKSMALIHQRLYQEDNLTGIQVKDYLSRLSRNLFTSYNINEDRIKLDLAIDDLNIDVDTLIPVGLILNELISNALKYAFPGNMEGTINVGLHLEGDLLRLQVSDDGIGLNNARKDRLESSFGFQMINALSSQLDADLKVASKDGTHVNLYIRDYKMVS